MCQVLVFATDDLTPGRPRIGEPAFVYEDGTISAANNNLPNPNTNRPYRLIEFPGVPAATWKALYWEKPEVETTFSTQYGREIMSGVKKRNRFGFDFLRDVRFATTIIGSEGRTDTVTKEEHDRMLTDSVDGKSVEEKSR